MDTFKNEKLLGVPVSGGRGSGGGGHFCEFYVQEPGQVPRMEVERSFPDSCMESGKVGILSPSFSLTRPALKGNYFYQGFYRGPRQPREGKYPTQVE